MDKTAIKKYAIWARRELIDKVSQKAMHFGIEKGSELNCNLDSINGVLLTDVEKKQRQALINRINKDGYEQVMEEVAYTWFNRFIALRFMEVNGYLPSHVRVFSDENNLFKPQIISEALHLDFASLSHEKVIEMKQANQDEELYKYLLISQCNELSDILPEMFQRIEDYTELLLPDYLLRNGSVIEQMVTTIPEQDWTNQVQIIGWLYQYYNTEPKALVFGRASGEKIKKEEVPAATQLFTPDWIVRYMVENSLGRLWIEGHPESNLRAKWKYYLDEYEQSDDALLKKEEIKESYSTLQLKDIKCIDPCCGSGHILSYLFDILVDIYEECGYSSRDAVQSIVENNLYGLDVDDRAAQLAYFSVMMKARQYDRRFFQKRLKPNVYSVQDSNQIDKYTLEYFCNNDSMLKMEISSIVEELKDAKEYGSTIYVKKHDWNLLYSRFSEIEQDISMYKDSAMLLLSLVKIANMLEQKYHVVVTNPPYMGSDGMDDKLAKYVKKKFNDCKADMYAVFIKRCSDALVKNGLQAMITQHSWMFLSSFEKMRTHLISNNTIVNMAHLGPRAFEEISGEVVQTVAWIMRNGRYDYTGTYQRLVDPNTQDAKEELFLKKTSMYHLQQHVFETIPGMPVAYWISSDFQNLFKNGDKITEFVSSRDGLTTGKNDLFIKYFWEINYDNIGFSCSNAEEFWDTGKKYAPLLKGGQYRKWYGNNWFVITYDKAGYNTLSNCGNKLPSRESYFLPYISWNRISTRMAFRYAEKGYLFESASLVAFSQNEEDMMYALAFANSILADKEMKMINPTTNMLSGYVDELRLPNQDIKSNCVKLARECLDLSRNDWNSFETSWDFIRHPLVPENKGEYRIENLFSNWNDYCQQNYKKLKKDEEEINQLFVSASSLEKEIEIDVNDEDVSVRLADRTREIKSLISYAVGCMFGRYSLDDTGIVYAGGNWDENKYKSFSVDGDNIIPICDDDYFDDDIVERFIQFVRIVYGEENLEENLGFISEAIGGKGTSRECIRKYFLTDFYADHLKIYQKRPIYWLFDSGKKNGFKCLIYMHRYQPDTIARIRTDYVHEQQARYRTAIEEIANRIENVSGSDKVKLTKKLNTLKEQNDEIHGYEEKIHHLADQMIRINLDDGVKKNYEIFKDVLAKI